MSSIQFGLKKTLFSVGYYSYLSLQYLILVSLKQILQHYCYVE